MGFLTPYYHGKHRWDDYLLDIQHAIQEGNAALQEQTLTSRNFQGAFKSSLEEMNAEFEWGFSLIASRISAQTAQLSEISEKLDDIYDTLKTPLGSRAGELFNRGQDYRRNGLLVEALQAYLKAEKKNKVNFVLQLQIGMLFLYGRNETDNVIDLTQAERHLLLAARYANAEKFTTCDWHKYCGQAYFHAAIAAYLTSEEQSNTVNSGMMRSCLERAIEYLQHAATLWPQFTDTIYTQAKCHILLEQNQEVLEKMKALSDRDRRYLAKASLDKDFESIFPEIERVFKQALISPGPQAQATTMQLQRASEAVSWAKKSNSQDDTVIIDSVEREIATASQLLLTLEVNIDRLSQRPAEWIDKLETIAEKSFQANIRAIQSEIDTIETRHRSGRNEIEKLQCTTIDARGAGWGCLTSIIAFFVFSVLAQVLLSRFGYFWLNYFGINENELMARVFGTIAILITMLGFAAAMLVRRHKNRQHRLKVQKEINKIAYTLTDCGAVLSGIRQRAKAWQKESDCFRDWKEHNSKDLVVSSLGTHA